MSGQWSLPKQLAVAAALVITVVGGWYAQDTVLAAFGGGKTDPAGRTGPADRSTPVIVAPVGFASDDLILEAVGTGRANRSVMLRAEAEGRIVEMPLEPGKRFEARDVLLRINDTEQQLAVDLARTRLEDARRTADRLAQLRGRGAATVSSLDDARTASEIAAIELGRAEETLSNHILRAPFDGVAGLADVELGAWVGTDVPVASFDDRSVILVEFDLPEAFLPRVDEGLPVSATTPAVPGKRFEGHVSVIDSRIVASNRSVKVRVAIPNPDDSLRPGASFTVRLELPGERFPVVPELALQFGSGSLHVWRVDGDIAERVEVRLVRRRDGTVLVDGPLEEGDRLVTEGTQRLVPGEPVRVLERREGRAA